MEILYQLGTTQDAGTSRRVHALLCWLLDTAQAHVRHQASVFSLPPAPSPASEHVHCVAAILWQSQERGVDYDLLALLTSDLIR